jgi:hypothetical protein
MLVLWDSQRFEAVVDYDTWEDELLEGEDIVRHIQAGALVPGRRRSGGVSRLMGLQVAGAAAWLAVWSRCVNRI